MAITCVPPPSRPCSRPPALRPFRPCSPPPLPYNISRPGRCGKELGCHRAQNCHLGRIITDPGRHLMIVDCHTHVWQSPDQLGQLVLGDMFRHNKNRPARATLAAPVMRSVPSADVDHHWAQSGTVDKSIVLGFKSRYLRAEIPNQYVSDYVNRFPQKLIGFAGIDPTES